MKPTIIEKLGILTSSILITGLTLANFQQGNAIQYNDGSVDEYLTKVKVEPYKGKNDLWVYIVRACATDHNLAVTEVILKSDIDQKVLGVNKTIAKGKCLSFGAVMKAKDGNTLGAELIEKHEAISKMQNLINDMPNLTKNEKKSAWKELIHLIATTGLIPR